MADNEEEQRKNASRSLWSGAVLIVLACALLFPLFGPAFTASAGVAPAGTAIASDEWRLADAPSLASIVSDGLDIGPLDAMSNNSATVTDVPTVPESKAWGNSSAPFQGYYFPSAHWWGASSNGSLVGLLYNSSGNLVEVRGLLANGDAGEWTATNASYEAAARALAQDLGLGADDIPYATVVEEDLVHDHFGNVERREVGVTLYGTIDGMGVAGSNLIYVHFTNFNVTKFSLYPFRDAQLNAAGGEAAATGAVREYIELRYGEVRYIDGPSVLSMAWDQKGGSAAYLVRVDINFSEEGLEIAQTQYFLVDPSTATIRSFVQYDGVTAYNIGSPVPVVGLPHQDAVPWWLVLSAVVAVVGAAALLCWPPELVFLAFSSLSLFLYSRLKEDELLNNYRRGLIHGYIIAHPGASFSELRRSLDLPNGPLVYHLGVLERNGLIKHRRLRNIVEYYGSAVDSRDATTLQLTELQLNIVNIVGEMGSISRADLREGLKCSHQTLQYNLNKLVSLGVLEKRLQWGRWHFRLHPQLDPRAVRGRPPPPEVQ